MAADPHGIESLTRLAASPVAVRVVVGVVGGVLDIAGARVYKTALLLASFAVGAVAAVTLLHLVAGYVAVPASAVVVAAMVAGIGLVLLASWVHKVALGLVGAFLGATVAGAAVAMVDPLTPWWVPVVGGLVGAASMPWLFPVILKIITPAIGAALVAWAAGVPTNPYVLVGVWAFGVVVQFSAGRAEKPAMET